MIRRLLPAILLFACMMAFGVWRVCSNPAAPLERRNFDPLGTLSDQELETLTAGRASTENMVLIPRGKFIMGSDFGDADESPAREVILDAFYIDRTEVTNSEYKKFVDATAHRTPKASLTVHIPFEWVDGNYPSGRGDHPVVLVSWEDAISYSIWMGKRLPTEAEWEKAARGTDARKYPWGDEWQPDRCNSSKAARLSTTPVGNFPDGASSSGCLDMAGNVLEWCLDFYQRNYYHPVGLNPQGPEAGVPFVVRGGSWADRDMRCSNRFQATPPHRLPTIGFRCALSAEVPRDASIIGNRQEGTKE